MSLGTDDPSNSGELNHYPLQDVDRKMHAIWLFEMAKLNAKREERNFWDCIYDYVCI